MKRVILYLWLALSFSLGFTVSAPQIVVAQTVIHRPVNTSATPPALRPVLIQEYGESNSGGEAPNDSLTSTELLAQPQLQILNNNTLAFESIHIGHNNNIGHFGEDSTTHGFQVGLFQNIASNSTVWHTTAYIVQCGQGGAIAAALSKGNPSGYYAAMITRMQAAIALKPTVQIVCWYTQGINDEIQGTDTATWAAQTKLIFTNMRADLGYNIPIVWPLFMPGHDLFNAAIIGISKSYPGVYVVSSTGARVQGDNRHWTASGYKVVAAFLCTQTLGLIKNY